MSRISMKVFTAKFKTLGHRGGTYKSLTKVLKKVYPICCFLKFLKSVAT